ncbi:MAG: DNA alkylation repair protein [Eubacteriales bacterium]|nr:DNA alkylation repair protein [Eubacteriales bacterium]
MNHLAETIQASLFEMQDMEYRSFHCRLMPTVDPEKVIGVRTPRLRKFAKDFAKTPEAPEYLKLLPHQYYEENNLHGFLIESIGDYEKTIAALDEFLPFVDNWATCDLMSPKVFAKHPSELLEKIKLWLVSEQTYTVRFAIGMLMRFYLDDQFDPEYPKLVASVKSDEYYINMMIAWYFATALAKQYQDVLPWLQEKKLSPWTHNKAIQKAVESRRITEDQKAYLRTLKVK